MCEGKVSIHCWLIKKGEIVFSGKGKTRVRAFELHWVVGPEGF